MTRARQQKAARVGDWEEEEKGNESFENANEGRKGRGNVAGSTPRQGPGDRHAFSLDVWKHMAHPWHEKAWVEASR